MNNVPYYERSLAGIRVIELASLIAGSMIGMMPGDHGAEVVKVGQPGAGDGLRGRGNRKNGVSLHHKMLNPDKRLVTADLRTPTRIDAQGPAL